MIELANLCIKQSQDMSRTLVCVKKALDGERFTCSVRENGGLAPKVCQVLQGSQLRERHLDDADSLFKGMGNYMIDIDSDHDPLKESEPLEEFVPKMFHDLLNHPYHFLFVKIDRTLVGYANAMGLDSAAITSGTYSAPKRD
jgi:hypothetical protein